MLQIQTTLSRRENPALKSCRDKTFTHAWQHDRKSAMKTEKKFYRHARVILAIFLINFSAAAAIAPAAEKQPQFRMILPETCSAGKSFNMRFESGMELPASSFYRIEIACPVHPENAVISALTGFPESSVDFSLPGSYECEIEAGIVTKNSCAGAQYKKLAARNFKIECR